MRTSENFLCSDCGYEVTWEGEIKRVCPECGSGPSYHIPEAFNSLDIENDYTNFDDAPLDESYP